jgi:hypothetical protein
MDAMMIVAVGGFALLSEAASWRMAAGKSRRVWLWTTVGMLFNVPGMIVVAALPVHLLATEPAAAAVPLGTPEQSTHATAV